MIGNMYTSSMNIGYTSSYQHNKSSNDNNDDEEWAKETHTAIIAIFNIKHVGSLSAKE